MASMFSRKGRGHQVGHFSEDVLDTGCVSARQGLDSSKLKCLRGLVLEVVLWCVKDLELSP